MLTDQMIADALPHLRAGARKLTCDQDAANDLLQETFLKASKYKRSYRGESSLTTWLHTVMRSVRFAHRTEIERNTSYSEPWLVVDQVALENVEKQVEALQVLQKLDRIIKKPTHRAIFMHTLLGESDEEVSRITGVGATTVRSRVCKIRQTLNERIAA